MILPIRYMEVLTWRSDVLCVAPTLEGLAPILEDTIARHPHKPVLLVTKSNLNDSRILWHPREKFQKGLGSMSLTFQNQPSADFLFLHFDPIYPCKDNMGESNIFCSDGIKLEREC
jgi:hypothetical protein